MQEITNLNREDRVCEDREDYSLTRCLQKFAADLTDCHVEYSATGVDQEKHCSIENFRKYFDLLIWIKQSKISQVVEKSGCHPKCKIVQYSFETTQRAIDWTPNWTSEVYVQPKSSFVEYSTEYLSFDQNDLISNLGGNLGLFLGWSLLTISEALGFIICVCRLRNREKT